MVAIAEYPVSEKMSILVYEIDDERDKVLAGVDREDAEWCNLNFDPLNDMDVEDTPYFIFNACAVPLSKCNTIYEG
ncbi:hypothetical protein Q7A53_05785 [Halobacillus rhizosphaerae]|uniref:hypothetical protein n=1 Tax=Halobacillus rhizosphaerae TaxID=3064889 RepID=UPI00398AD4CE